MTDVKTKNEMRSLPCRLTNDEKLANAELAAREHQMLTETEEQQKEAASQFKAKIAGHNARIKHLSSMIASGYEWREVECEETVDFDADCVRVTRRDTGEVVDTRALTIRERQMQITFPAAA